MTSFATTPEERAAVNVNVALSRLDADLTDARRWFLIRIRNHNPGSPLSTSRVQQRLDANTHRDTYMRALDRCTRELTHQETP